MERRVATLLGGGGLLRGATFCCVRYASSIPCTDSKSQAFAGQFRAEFAPCARVVSYDRAVLYVRSRRHGRLHPLPRSSGVLAQAPGLALALLVLDAAPRYEGAAPLLCPGHHRGPAPLGLGVVRGAAARGLPPHQPVRHPALRQPGASLFAPQDGRPPRPGARRFARICPAHAAGRGLFAAPGAQTARDAPRHAAHHGRATRHERSGRGRRGCTGRVGGGMPDVRTRPRQTILQTIVAWGYEPLEVTWVGWGWAEGGYWAATFREPGTFVHYSVVGPYVGKVLTDILSLPCLAEECPPVAVREGREREEEAP